MERITARSAALAAVLAVMALAARADQLSGHVEESDVKRLPRPSGASINNSLEIKILKAQSRPDNKPLSGAIETSDFFLPMKRLEPLQAPLLPPTRPAIATTAPTFVDNYWLVGFEQRRRGKCCWPVVPDLRPQWLRETNRLTSRLSASKTNAQLLSSPLPANWPALPAVMQQSSARQQSAVQDENIVWNDWYSRVSNQIYNQWSRQKKRSGCARVAVVVSDRREITGSIITSTSTTFSSGLLAAISSLNQLSVLQFPVNSRRTQVSFEASFTSGETTKPGLIQSAANDLETVRRSSK